MITNITGTDLRPTLQAAVALPPALAAPRPRADERRQDG
jgi:hypothetical protein